MVFTLLSTLVFAAYAYLPQDDDEDDAADLINDEEEEAKAAEQQTRQLHARMNNLDRNDDFQNEEDIERFIQERCVRK